MDLAPYLEDLNRRINADEEDRLAGEWLSFADGSFQGSFFSPSRSRPSPPAVNWPDLNINPCIEDAELMIYRELKGVSDTLAAGKGELLAIRPNYGTGIIPSMYGAEVFIMPEETNTLPCTRPLPGAGAAVKEILDKGKMDFSRALAGRVFEFVDRWAELSLPYKLVRRYVYLYNPDLQGPFPLVDMLWGSDIYTDIFDEPETVQAAAAFFTDVIIEFLGKYHALCPPFDANHSVEWGLLHSGAVIIRNDAAMNISGKMYREFVMPHDQRIIKTFGGGMHFCGKGDHYIAHVSEIKGLSAINMSQPEYNNMETIYQNTIDRGIVIVGMPGAEVERAVAAGRNLRGRVHSGASLAAWADKGSERALPL